MPFDPEQELDRFRAQLVEAESTVGSLQQIVSLLEAMQEQRRQLALRTRRTPGTRRMATPTEVIEMTIPRPQGGRRGAGPGGKGLKEVLRDLYADAQRRSVDDAIADALNRGLFTEDNLPKRASFTNRLNDLANEGYLRQVRRGVHELASPNGSAPSVETEGTEQPNPPGVLPGQGEGLGERPAEGLDQPPGRDPDSGATAGAAGRP